MGNNQSMERIHFLESNPVLIRQVLDPAQPNPGGEPGRQSDPDQSAMNQTTLVHYHCKIF